MLTAREQHIRREKATSNICTSQALLANMAAMYAVYHGAFGIKRIAERVHTFTQLLKQMVEGFGYEITNGAAFFDTLTIDIGSAGQDVELIHRIAIDMSINLRRVDERRVGVTLDESVAPSDLVDLVNVFALASGSSPVTLSALPIPEKMSLSCSSAMIRTSEYLHHPVFNTHHSETEMLRYLHHLQAKDLSLVHAMIPLGSCTMKLNSTSSMIPLTWPEFSNIHPFVPVEQTKGYAQIVEVSNCTFGSCINWFICT
jgi:glycine cleavage system P protein (glycine dehydrogenase)